MVIRPRPGGVPFGRYLIRRKLGRGGMGEVFLADQLGPLGPVRPVALKRMLPSLAADPDTARLFLEEMAIAAQLNHPNIATTYDFGEIEGDLFLAMEYVEGLPLNRIIESIGPLPAPVALEIAKQVADALVYAHAKPVVHHDVSPHNVMISREGAVKLLDFGIARAGAAVRGDRVRGKVPYAAPEQLRGAAPDRRSDLWSLGVMLYESLTGRRPFEGDDPASILRAADGRDYPKLSSLRPEAAPFEELITRALEPDPDRRWLGAEAFRAACLRLGSRFGLARSADLGLLVERAGGLERSEDEEELPGTGVAALEPTKTKPDRSRSRWPLAVLALSVVLAGASVAWLSGDRAPPAAPMGMQPIEVAPPPAAPPPAAPAPTAPPPPPAPPPPTVRPRRPRIDARVAPKRPVRRKPKKRATPAEGFGKLSVRTDPTWARLSWDGQSIGRTILYGRPFDPGTHRLRMMPGDDAFAPLEATIIIKPGVTTNVFADFRTRKVRVVER